MSIDKYQQLALIYKEPEKVAVNLNWEDGGSHWVGCKSKDNLIKYYDPFGVSHPFKKLDKKRSIICNNIQDQELDEQNCGWRTLFFLLND